MTNDVQRAEVIRANTGNNAPMRPWLIAAVWFVWFVVAAGTGYAGSDARDKIANYATTVSVRADVVMLLSMFGAVGAAISLRQAALPGTPWLGVALGLALVTCGLALRHWAARTLGPFFTRSVAIRSGHRVIDTGPYRFVRHPGYTGTILSLVGLALTLWNWVSFLILVAGWVLAFIPRIKAEEAVLEANLDGPYREFERARKRLIPGVW
jgi:protein-S-isoprenylcysteine O-methyltransferase Ste14